MKLKNEMLIVMIFLLVLAGCTAGDISLPTVVPLPTDTPVIALTPSTSPLPTNTPVPTQTLQPTPTLTLSPVTHTVTEKDDMFGLALRFGISLDALKAANPNVIPNMMGVGTVLIIPVTPTPPSTSTGPGSPTPTPDPFSPLRFAMEPICYQDALGGAYCFAQLENISNSPVENPSVRFTLNGSDSTALEMDGILPLNILPAQETMPIVAYFPSPVPTSYEVSAQITDWLPVMPDDARYLNSEIVAESQTIAVGAGFAEVTGVVNLAQGQADYVWVLGVAFDANRQVLGLRRWEPEAPLPNGNAFPFEFRVYAMQGEIAEVKLFVEALASIP